MIRAFVIALLVVACRPEDDVKTDATPTPTGDTGADTTDTGPDTTDTGGTDTGTTPADPSIEGSWRSEGANIAPLFQLFYYARIDADFATDGTYDVEVEDTSGGLTTFTGTYVVDTATDPATIVLTQITPFKATAEGIWQVDGDTMTYEVTQTVPDAGFSPATPAGGFGSTAGPGLSPGDNVQIYVRQ